MSQVEEPEEWFLMVIGKIMDIFDSSQVASIRELVVSECDSRG